MNVRVNLILAENFVEAVARRKEESFLKDRKREVELGYCAKVNGRSIIIGPEYVAIIRPLC